MKFAADFRWIARQALRGKWGISLLVTLAAGFLGVATHLNVFLSSITDKLAKEEGAGIGIDAIFWTLLNIKPFLGVAIASAFLGLVIYIAVTFIIGGGVHLGLCRYYIGLIRQEEQRPFDRLFSRFHIWGRAFVLFLLMGIFIFLWSILLIVPGIIAIFRYSMAPYLLAQNPHMGAMEALRESSRIMRGRKGGLFCLHFSFIGWHILAAITCGIGYLWIDPYIWAAEAAFYLEATGQLEELERRREEPPSPRMEY